MIPQWELLGCDTIQSFTNVSDESAASALTSTLNTEAAGSFETLVTTCQIVQYHNPQDNNLRFHCDSLVFLIGLDESSSYV
jgi:hypothetical protein